MPLTKTLPYLYSQCHSPKPCILSRAKNLSKYFHPKLWKTNFVQEPLKYEPTGDVQLVSCICRLCWEDVSTISDKTFVPRWRPKNNYVLRSKMQMFCAQSNKGCRNCAAFLACRLVAMIPVMTVENSFCMKHYGVMYRYTSPSQAKCRTCDRRIADVTKSHSCPEPVLVQKCLEQNTEFADPIRWSLMPVLN